MKQLFDITKFDSYKEGNRREVKKANGGLPNALWETYSAFANTYGGVILLGIKELDDKNWRSSGLKIADKEKLLDDFWNTIHNPNKVNVNLLSEDDIKTYEVGEDLIIAIYVPMAKREQKPVFINKDMFGGTFRRDHSGDYHCTSQQIKAMLRDQTENSMDMTVLDDVSLNELNSETVQGYRNRHRILRPGHPFERLNDAEYLRSIGAAAVSAVDRQLHPTAAGMLMFGDEYNIVRYFPDYFLDYREVLDPEIRWTDRLQSSSGEWSGNICDFYFRVYNKIAKDIKVPFKTTGGERAGSGVPNIFNIWENEGWVEPLIEEQFSPDRTILTLEFTKKVMKKGREIKIAKRKNIKGASKMTLENYNAILNAMKPDIWYKTDEFESVVEVKTARAKETRIIELLTNLYKQGKIEITENAEGKLYKKVDK